MANILDDDDDIADEDFAKAVAQSEAKNTIEDDPLISAINDDPTDQGTFECQCYVTTGYPLTHHWDEIAYSIEQENKESNYMLSESFAALCDEAYASGDNDITIKT